MGFSFNEKQRAALEKLDLPADPETVFMIIEMQLNYLMTHNKNYTKAQYERVDYINDIINAIYRNFKED